MEHAKDYEIIRTEEGVLMFVIKARKGEPLNPRLVYDGGNHATLYRKSEEVILLDYLNPEILETLKKAEFVIVAEADYKKNTVVKDYKVRVKTVKNNPFCDNLE